MIYSLKGYIVCFLEKIENGVTTYYLRSGMEVLAEYNGVWNVKSEYVYGVNGMVAQMDADGRESYFLKDWLGNTRQLSGANLRRDYFPFGEHYIASGDGTHYLFTGKELDEGTGLSYFGAGYYDPGIGRWLSVDPILSRKSPVNLIQLGVINESPYVYTSNNPIIYIDNDGLIKWGVVGKGVLKFTSGLVGTAISGYALVQTGGGATLFGATLGFTTGLAGMSLGLSEIIAGFADKDFALSEGFIVAVSTELGVDKKTAQKLAMIWDLFSVGTSAGDVVSKTGTTLDELALLLNSQCLSDDIKAQIQEYLKEQQQQKQKEEGKKDQKKDKEEDQDNNNS